MVCFIQQDTPFLLFPPYTRNEHSSAISRIDRLEDRCTILEAQGRSLATQRRNLKLAHELLENGWGLFLGDSEAQQQEILGQLELVEVRVRFSPKVMGFIAEDPLRHPSQQIEPYPPGALNRKTEYVDYVVKLPPRSLREFSFWVYRFMGQAQVRSPESLVEQHRQAVQQQEKIKTIGDAYMVAAGLPTPRADHAEAIAEMALAMQQVTTSFQAESGEPLAIRIGINTGVAAGVIGTKKFIYDLWGDAVHVASHMESLGEPGMIQLTAATYARLKDHYRLEKRGSIAVKGRGDMET